MKKILAAFICLLGLAVIGVPAHASPMRKKITIDCSDVTAPDYLTGSATVTLCASSATDYCGAGTYDCPAVACDSSGVSAPISVTVACNAPFKVDYVTGHADDEEFDASGNLVATGGSNIGSTLGRKGYSILYPVNSPGTAAVSLTIK